MKELITPAARMVRNSIPKKTAKANQYSAEEIRLSFENQLRNIYWSEKELAAVLPEMEKMATSYELANAIQEHHFVTEKQIIRLIHVFGALGERATPSRCETMESMLANNEKALLETEPGFSRDAAIIAFCQKVMHYEIASYGMLLAYAKNLDEDAAAEHLATAIEEEKNAHAILTELGLSSIYFGEAS